LEVFTEYLKGIWERQWLTNNGPLVQELEEKLRDYLGVKHLIFVNNGTIALQIALKAIAQTGEVITTPFSYVATTNTILWEGFKPVFADINVTDFNIDTKKIEPLITENTVAIMATHVYGNPCDVHGIEKIASKYNLPVIYDGAHAFGSTLNGKQVLSYGDIATCSFHATKIFHTIEGGAIITHDDALAEKMILYRQFGHAGDEYFSIGINGKNSELHAAMGLCTLPRINEFIGKRMHVTKMYDDLLKNLPINKPEPLRGTVPNYSYYPVVFNGEAQLVQVKTVLQLNNIVTRRYFFPSLNKLPQHSGENCPVAEDISLRVLALPLFTDLGEAEIQNISSVIKSCF
jgi:dTDP-4-amino-4,6-dideoxygalactose transaminase